MAENNVDGYLISSETNVTYLTGFTGDSSRLLVTPNGCVFITDGRYTEQAAMECPSAINIVKWIDEVRFGAQTYYHHAKELGVNVLAVEGDVLSVNSYNEIKDAMEEIHLETLDGLIEEMRQVKDKEDIESLRKACKISDKALEQTLPFIKEGVTEAEIVAKLEYNIKMNGAEGLSFDTMVLSGSKTSLLHGHPGDKKIEKGDFILFDFGAVYKGFHADISRAFIMGEASDEQIEVYNIIKEAQQKAVESIKNGVEGTHPDDIVRSIIPEKYIEHYYPGLGHGVGLQIHEQPFIRHTSKFEYKSGMTVTIEPGIYIPGKFGLRIEDTILVTDDGVEVLNSFPRELQIL